MSPIEQKYNNHVWLGPLKVVSDFLFSSIKVKRLAYLLLFPMIVELVFGVVI